MGNRDKLLRMRDTMAVSTTPDVAGILAALIEIVTDQEGALVAAFQREPGPSEGAALHPGDVVRLRSGGPAMTVLGEPDEEGEVRCGWHDPTADVRMDRAHFLPAALRKVEDEARAEAQAKYNVELMKKAHLALDSVIQSAGRSDIDRDALAVLVSEAEAALAAELYG